MPISHAWRFHGTTAENRSRKRERERQRGPESILEHPASSLPLESIAPSFSFRSWFRELAICNSFSSMRRTRSPSHPLRIRCLIFLSYLVCGSFSAKVVTLESIQIFTTHEWFPAKPTLYFRCQGENATILPDVKETNFLYTFKGEESWQPLTELPDKKCKRCGIYEQDHIKSDDVFDEWEFCPGDFVKGKYVRFKEKELNATFVCPLCVPLEDGFQSSSSQGGATGHGMSVALVIIISTVVSTVVIAGAAVGYRYWQKKKREQDQARFLKLFEEGDDIEDELGLGNAL